MSATWFRRRLMLSPLSSSSSSPSSSRVPSASRLSARIDGASAGGVSVHARDEGSLDAQAKRRLSGPDVRVLDGEFARAPPLHPFCGVSPAMASDESCAEMSIRSGDTRQIDRDDELVLALPVEELLFLTQARRKGLFHATLVVMLLLLRATGGRAPRAWRY
jgi:hypothetical protein